MITYTTTKTEADLKGIYALQKANLKINLSEQEINQQGFVTVSHDLETLQKLSAIEPHIIAKDDEHIVGYVLAMTEASKYDVPIIFPMFEEFDKIIYQRKLVSEFNYMVVGQVCVHKDYRGLGIFSKCYDLYRNTFGNRYEFCITEIAVSNQRSRNAHKKIGFQEIHFYTDADQIEWVIVVWDWNN